MKKIITILSTIVIAIVSLTTPIYGAERVSNSATLRDTVVAKNDNDMVYVKKRIAIKKLLQEYDSPLADSADIYIDVCKTYQIDCYLLPAIAGLESSFGKYTWPGSYNPVGWGGGYIGFNSWNDSIETVGKALRENYINKGYATVDNIGPIYSESPTWAIRVQKFMDQFEQTEQGVSVTLDQPNLL